MLIIILFMMFKNFDYLLNFDYFECDKFDMFHIN